MKVRRLYRPTAEQRAAIVALDEAWLFGGKPPTDDDFDCPSQGWWAALDDDGKVVAFASAAARTDGSVMLTRAVVGTAARGQGLQRRLIDARVRWARRLGATRVWTYTSADNAKSGGNLCKAGFHYRGASEDGLWLYWRYEL